MAWPDYKGNIPKLCTALLQPGDRAVDIGAAAGQEATAMAESVGPTGTVVMVEPDARHAASLKLVTENFPHVRYVRGAVGAREAVMTLHRGEQPEHSSLCPDAVNRRVGIEDAIISTLDGPLFANAALVKIDAQGWECAILDGATRLLGECPNWIIECWPWGLKQAGRSVDDLLEQLRRAGLKLYWANRSMMNPRDFQDWLKACRRPSYTNLIAMR